MAMQFIYVKCVKSTNNNEFTFGELYKFFNTVDDVVVSKTGVHYGVNNSIAHESTLGHFSFELVSWDAVVSNTRERFQKGELTYEEAMWFLQFEYEEIKYYANEGSVK